MGEYLRVGSVDVVLCVCACNWCRPLFLEPNMCFSFCFVLLGVFLIFA